MEDSSSLLKKNVERKKLILLFCYQSKEENIWENWNKKRKYTQQS